MIAFLLSIISFVTPPKEASPWPFQHITKRDGLSNSAINAVYMDKRQYVWFGTWDGLNRYDGTSLKIYKPDLYIKGSISNNIIRNMVEDRLGNLWVVTHQGINRYDPNTDSFKSYFTNLKGLPFLEYNTKVMLGPDSLLWVNVTGRGTSYYDADNDDFIPVAIEGLNAEWMKDVAGAGSYSGIVYFLHASGELVSTINQRTIYRKKIRGREAFRMHYFFQMNEKYFLALVSDHSEFSVYDLSNMEAEPSLVRLSDFPVSSLSPNKNHTALWVGTEAGNIFKISLDRQGVFQASNMRSFFPQLPRSQRKILCITETAQDLLWVGTDGDGVFKFLTRQKPFQSIESGAPGQSALSNSIVRAVFEDNDGTVYIGTRSGGLNIISPLKDKINVINTRTGLSHNTVLSIGKDKTGNIWLGTDGEGIDMIESNTKRILHFPRDFENTPDMKFGNVYAMCFDVYGSVWLGTSGYGVIQLAVSKTGNGRYYLENHRQITYSPGRATSINSNVVYAITEEMPNILWFGTRGAGVYRYNTITHQVEEHFHTGSPGKRRLGNDDVLSMYKDSNDDLLIGTSGGLNRLVLQKRLYHNTHFSRYEGLPNNTIHGIQEDNNKMIWLSTNNGLMLFDPVKNIFRPFDANDGLQNNEFTDGASFRSPSGDKLYFGGINGLDVIYPAKVDTALSFPRLAISEFGVHNMIITTSDKSKILKNHIDMTRDLELDYDQNFISFHFTTLDFWNKQRTEYAYFLENFDKDWNHIGTQSVVNLTNIPPGDYRLHINYKKNGTWNPHSKQINISIRPPFWRTSWAYAFYILVVSGIQITIILYIRERARTKRTAAINKFRIQQMKELNDHKLQFFTNVAHEFRTPLTLILGPVSTLLKKADSALEKEQLKTIYNNSLRMQKLIEELLQFRKIESGKEEIKVSETELVAFTQEIVDTFSQHAADHEVQLEFIPQSESLKGWIDKPKIEKALINLISNAIKYNIKGGTVDVILYEKEGKACFKVKDSGPGIHADEQKKIFELFYNNPHPDSRQDYNSTGIGLSLTKSLVRIHHGVITLVSEPGHGSEFTIEIPIDEKTYQSAVVQDNPLLIHSGYLQEKVSQEFTLNRTGGALPFTPSADVHHNTILVVDDNDQITILLKSILSDKYKILTASNGTIALHLLESEKIDLVVSDILMPSMDGLTLCRKIKDNIQTSHIPVILLTAKAEIEDRIEGLLVGADSYIPKPFHPEHLFVRIEKLIQNREQIRKKFSNLATVELENISTGMGERDDQFFVRITQCIQKHLSDPEFTADVIAGDVGMSKASLYKKVKAITSLTPHGLIKQYRLKKAAALLRTTSMSVSEVIYETGFNSRSYFYKSFNEMFHCHPKDFGSRSA